MRFAAILTVATCHLSTTSLDCRTDLDCLYWSATAGWGACHAGTCSQCDTDSDCGVSHFCMDNVDGFGTCMAGSRS